jgi:hypothetical protein
MKTIASPSSRELLRVALGLFLLVAVSSAWAQFIPTADPARYGPFNGTFLPDGEGLSKPIAEKDTVLRADSPWTLYAWVQTIDAPSQFSLIAGVGDPTEEYPRYLAIDRGRIILWVGRDNELSTPRIITPNKWQFIAATFDGSKFHLFVDGVDAGASELTLGSVSPSLQIAPAMIPIGVGQKWRASWRHFGGNVAGLTLLRTALTDAQVKEIASKPPDFSLVVFEEGSKSWPVQTNGQAGYRAPQDPTTMPRGKAPFSAPVARTTPVSPALQSAGSNEWTVGAWKMIEAPKTKASGPEISRSGFNVKEWMVATVPGTVLTTMIDRGIYPDPDYGLNNLAIPESLNKQDYFYRTEFKVPASTSGHRLTLTFLGINYYARVWLNGKELGSIKGAFRRGVFDVTDIAKSGQDNVLAVRVSPPPHPGIPQEQSALGGPGENGGIMCLDGPTFVATEGWDWIPAIRDRNTGIWQPVMLKASGITSIGDPRVVTTLPLPDISSANVEIEIPVTNASERETRATVTATFDQVKVVKTVTLPPGPSSVKLTPAEFAQLHVSNPRLWWPNGYGKPELYDLKIAVEIDGKLSDTKTTRFGIREITYELSLLDSSGHLRRLEYSPTVAKSKDERVVDVSHAGMRELPPSEPYPPDMPAKWRPFFKSWAASLVPGSESSASLKPVTDTRSTPYLIIKVNGVRIACRGGNWGMDDSRKRVSREKLEPYFRLHRDANLNFIRNWVGQDTEETFYDLADEYGMLVWNDFWATTQNYNIEPQDPELFLDNARDTILHFRNHPSIAVWCGRNEGVPQPIISEGLANLIASLDGTRYYSPSSNQVNLQNSGPYKYMDPALYFTTLNRGFSVETGTPSMSTLESFRTWVPKEDQWPINDTWAYHDWHQSGNGDTGTFMAEIQAEFGAPTGLEDFERKAQMLNYINHRAIFEGMNAHLWAPNSARILWMTQPAWPSTMWQILSSDYDTQASYYGVKKACEKVHVQLDISNYTVAVVNNSTSPLPGLTVRAMVYSLDNKLLLNHEERSDASANAFTDAFKLDLAPLIADQVALIRLELRDASGKLISDNFYWLASENSLYRQLTRLPVAKVTASATSVRNADTVTVRVHLTNAGNAAALHTKLTMIHTDGSRILPAYFTDNYVSLLPNETRDVEIEIPNSAARGDLQVAMRGWNMTPTTVPVTPQK